MDKAAPKPFTSTIKRLDFFHLTYSLTLHERGCSKLIFSPIYWLYYLHLTHLPRKAAWKLNHLCPQWNNYIFVEALGAVAISEKYRVYFRDWQLPTTALCAGEIS